MGSGASRGCGGQQVGCGPRVRGVHALALGLLVSRRTSVEGDYVVQARACLTFRFDFEIVYSAGKDVNVFTV